MLWEVSRRVGFQPLGRDVRCMEGGVGRAVSVPSNEYSQLAPGLLYLVRCICLEHGTFKPQVTSQGRYLPGGRQARMLTGTCIGLEHKVEVTESTYLPAACIVPSPEQAQKRLCRQHSAN